MNFSGYQQTLSALAKPALQAAIADHATDAANETTAGSIVTAAPAALLLIEDQPGLYPALVKGFQDLAQSRDEPWPPLDPSSTTRHWSDSSGHRRAVYRPLVTHLYCWGFAKRYESLPSGVWGACEESLPALAVPARWIETFADVPPPPDQTAITLWWALCLLDQAWIAQRDVDIELVDAVVHKIVHRPGPGGSLHPSHDTGTQAAESHTDPGTGSAHEPTDRWIYDELCGLHALANLALARRNPAWAKRVEQIALHHLHHTQPDHVTNQPWAVFAFTWSPRSRLLADQVIHDATANASRSALTPLSAMLLADAAAALAAFDGSLPVAPDPRSAPASRSH